MRWESQPEVRGTGCFGRSPEEAERERANKEQKETQTSHQTPVSAAMPDTRNNQAGLPEAAVENSLPSATGQAAFHPHMHTSCSHRRAPG